MLTTAMKSEPAKSQMKRFRPSISSSQGWLLAGWRRRQTGRRGSQNGNCEMKRVMEERSMQPKKTRPCGVSKLDATHEMVPVEAKPVGRSPHPVSVSSRLPSGQPPRWRTSPCTQRMMVGMTASRASTTDEMTATAEKRWKYAISMLELSTSGVELRRLRPSPSRTSGEEAARDGRGAARKADAGGMFSSGGVLGEAHIAPRREAGRGGARRLRARRLGGATEAATDAGGV